MYGRDRADLKSLFQQPGLFMEQNFNRIRMKTQGQEIDEYFKKIPRGFVIKYKKRKAPAEKQRSPTPPPRRQSPVKPPPTPPKEKSLTPPPKKREKRRSITPPPVKREKFRSPTPKKRRSLTPKKRRSLTPKKRSPSPVRKPEKKEKRKRREPTPPPPTPPPAPVSRVARQRTPPKRRTRSSDDEANYTDNEVLFSKTRKPTLSFL